jgi:hypothetical protein
VREVVHARVGLAAVCLEAERACGERADDTGPKRRRNGAVLQRALNELRAGRDREGGQHGDGDPSESKPNRFHGTLLFRARRTRPSSRPRPRKSMAPRYI